SLHDSLPISGVDAVAAPAPARETTSGGAPQSLESPQSSDKTSVLGSTKMEVKLVFKPGQANVEEFQITKSEISIGRGTNCDVILTDAKSSRKHVSIKKVGNNYILQD